MAHHYGNAELINLIEAMHLSGVSLFVNEGILPGCNYTVERQAYNYTLLFHDMLVVSKILTGPNGEIYNGIIKVDNMVVDFSGLSYNQYGEIIVHLNEEGEFCTFITLENITDNTANNSYGSGDPADYAEYIYHRYSSYPWDKFGNMPLVSTENDTDICIGYIALYTVKIDASGTEKQYMQFIPQYAKTGMTGAKAYILPSYAKVNLGGGDGHDGKIESYISGNISIGKIMSPDHGVLSFGETKKLPESIAYTNVLYDNSIGEDVSYGGSTVEPPALMQKINSEAMQKFVYSGSLPYLLSTNDAVYPYFLYYDNNNGWCITIMNDVDTQEDSNFPYRSDIEKNIDDAFANGEQWTSGLNYIILYIDWGDGNLGIFPYKNEEAAS